jgi:membrane-associated phospholipid phosphatase
MRRLCTILLGLCAASAARAQKQPLGPERDDIRHFGGDIWGVWTGPAHTTAHDILPTLGAAGVVALTSTQDSVVYQWLISHPNTLVMKMLRPLREGWHAPLYELGSGQYILPMAAVLYTAGRLTNNVDLRDAGLGCAAGHLSSAGLRDLIYALVSRERPRITPEPGHIAFPGVKNWDDHSFLSGHIANSMSCASFLGHRFALGAAEPLPYIYSSMIGLGRMSDGRHWFSDTMAGALMGWAIGRTIANRQLARESRIATTTAAKNGEKIPVPVFQWSFAF